MRRPTTTTSAGLQDDSYTFTLPPILLGNIKCNETFIVGKCF